MRATSVIRAAGSIAALASVAVAVQAAQAAQGFEEHPFIAAGPSGVPDVEIGDFNDDKRNDIAVAYHGGVSIVAQTANRVYAPPLATLDAWGDYGYVTDIESADLDGDRDLDFAVAQGGAGAVQDGGVSIFEQRNSGFFMVRHFQVEGGSLWSMAIGDVDRDGLRDLVVAGSRVTVLYQRTRALIRRGIGTFREDRISSPGRCGRGGEAGECHFSSIAIGDLNHRGALDIVAADLWGAGRGPADGSLLSGSIEVYRSTGSGFRETSLTVGRAPSKLVVADLVGNDELDIAVIYLADTDAVGRITTSVESLPPGTLDLLRQKRDQTFEAVRHVLPDVPGAGTASDPAGAPYPTGLAVGRFAERRTGLVVSVAGPARGIDRPGYVAPLLPENGELGFSAYYRGSAQQPGDIDAGLLDADRLLDVAIAGVRAGGGSLLPGVGVLFGTLSPAPPPTLPPDQPPTLPPTCPDDAAENDDSSETATTLPADGTVDRLICPADADYFRISVLNGKQTIRFTPASGVDVSITLDGKVVNMGGTGAEETVEIAGSKTPDHELTVSGVGESTGAYTVTTSLVP